MRVIGRMLLGTLAIVFALVFVARLVARRPVAGRRQALPLRVLDVAPRALEGDAWGACVVPAASQRARLRPRLRRKGKRGGNRGARVVRRRRAALTGARLVARCKKPWAP